MVLSLLISRVKESGELGSEGGWGEGEERSVRGRVMGWGWER